MKKGKILLLFIFVSTIPAGISAFKVQRVPRTIFTVDVGNPNPALRLCTKTAIGLYTTVFLDALPGAPPITTFNAYTSPVNSTVCPRTTFYSAD